MAPRAKTALLIPVVIVANVAGNSALSSGMRHSESSLLSSLTNPWVMAGVVLLIAWTLARMALLSRADLSYVLPVTALGYVLTALAGRFLFAEIVTAERWAGTVLIVAGAAIAGSTKPESRTQ